MSTSKQDLRRLVRITSRSQEESEEDIITLLTSFVEGAKDESRGGGAIGAWSVGGIAGSGSFEHRSDILS